LVLRLFIVAMLAGLVAPAVPAPPARDPHTAGYVAAKELPDGVNPPMDKDGNFILGTGDDGPR
jgi:hypothetical protein